MLPIDSWVKRKLNEPFFIVLIEFFKRWLVVKCFWNENTGKNYFLSKNCNLTIHEALLCFPPLRCPYVAHYQFCQPPLVSKLQNMGMKALGCVSDAIGAHLGKGNNWKKGEGGGGDLSKMHSSFWFFCYLMSCFW